MLTWKERVLDSQAMACSMVQESTLLVKQGAQSIKEEVKAKVTTCRVVAGQGGGATALPWAARTGSSSAQGGGAAVSAADSAGVAEAARSAEGSGTTAPSALGASPAPGARVSPPPAAESAPPTCSWIVAFAEASGLGAREVSGTAEKGEGELPRGELGPGAAMARWRVRASAGRREGVSGKNRHQGARIGHRCNAFTHRTRR